MISTINELLMLWILNKGCNLKPFLILYFLKSRKPEPVPEIKFRKQQGNSNINFIILNRYDYTNMGNSQGSFKSHV